MIPNTKTMWSCHADDNFNTYNNDTDDCIFAYEDQC